MIHTSYVHSVVCNTLPSAVTAANTVDEYGAQATSPTELFKSKVKRGFLQCEIQKETLKNPPKCFQILFSKYIYTIS